MKTRAALFDLDGTLVDNMSFHADAWLAFAAARGIPASRERFEREFAGRKNDEILPVLLGRAVSPEEAAALADEKERAYRALYAAHVAPLPGVLDLLDRLRARGVRLAVASAAPPENRAFVLERLDLSRAFDAVVGAEHVARGKPAPDLFLAAAERVGAAPEACVVFEDAVHGVTAGVAAGCAVVAVTTTASGDALRGAGARWVVEDFTRLPADLEGALFSS